MATATLTRPTDTPKAKRAPKTVAPSAELTITRTAPTATPAAPTLAAIHAAGRSHEAKRLVSIEDGAKFVKACTDEESALITKLRVCGVPALAGAAPAAIRTELSEYLKAAGLKVGNASGVSHYCAAYKLAAIVGMQDVDKALSRIYTFAHGAVPIALYTARLEEFRSDATGDELAAEVIAYVNALAKRKGLPIAPAVVAPVAPVAEVVAPVTVAPDVNVSTLSDVKRGIKTFRALFALLKADDKAPADYFEAFGLMTEFAAELGILEADGDDEPTMGAESEGWVIAGDEHEFDAE